VNIVTDRDSGQPRGFGFVEMTNDAEGNCAIGAINGKEVGGRALNVNEARPKSEAGGRGFGDGRGPWQQRWWKRTLLINLTYTAPVWMHI